MQYTTVILQLQIQVIPQTDDDNSDVNQPAKSATGAANTLLPWMGIFQDDPQWGQIFDEIEQRRNEHLIGG